MDIRTEMPTDRAAIAAVTAEAFAGVAHSNQREPAIIEALRIANALSLSLVAEDDGAVIGHAAFSAVTTDGTDAGWFGLGPVAVRPDRQGRGIGAALIRHGLAALGAQGAAGCVVLGNPGYYERFGFGTGALRYPGAPTRYFLCLGFCRPVPNGVVAYHAAFGS